ncbi:uncharacterized protein [Pagrus major]|uniref:uncharacterized protein n=1 Tax=Pagrus major TaxID=143350 RepID=UPI003CC88C4A
MTHVKRFQGIPMSKSMRGLCKEEDYVFLGTSENTTKETAEGAGALEDDWREKKEERVRDEEEPKHTIITPQATEKTHTLCLSISVCVCVFQVRWRLEREQQEKERLREIEEGKKEREQQWRTHVAHVASSQEKTLQDRLARLRRFREFQRKVLVEESGMEGGAAGLAVNQLLTRM